MTRIAFVNPLTLPLDLVENTWTHNKPGIQTLAAEGVSLPMGIMYLSAHLKKNIPDIQVDLIDYRVEFPNLSKYASLDHFIGDIAAASLDQPPDIIAFSLIVSSSHQFFKRTLGILKQMWPKAQVIAGGFHATNFTKQLLELPGVDYVFRGESEYALHEFLAAWPISPEHRIQGVISRAEKDSGPFSLCKPLVSMDDNPLPDYGLPDMSRYVVGNTRMVIKQTGDSVQRSANIMTSLGCPFVCTFCASRTVHGRKMRFKSIENVVAEFKLLHEQYGVTLFMPEDDLFTANKKRTLKLLEAIKELKIPNFRMQFPVALSVNTLSYEVIDSLIECGMDVASLAIESGSRDTQHRIIKKDVDLDKAKEWVRYLRTKNLPIRTSFILGFPGESRAMMDESIEYARNLGADWYDFFIATPLAGSEMCQEFVDLGYMPDDIEVISRGYYSRRNFDTPEIKQADLVDLVYRANLLCNFKDNINFRLGLWEKALKLFTPIATKHPFHILALDCVHRCHAALGNAAEADKALAALATAVATDDRAQSMAEKYGDLLSDEARAALAPTGAKIAAA
ncbi:MAG: radical SAM protein [Rhodoblastus sp.]